MIFEQINDLEKELILRFDVNSSFEKPIREFHYDTCKEECGINLKNLIHSIYSIHNGFNLIWKFEEQIIGEINIPRIIYCIVSDAQEELIQVYKEWEEEFKTFARKFYPLDIYEEALDSVTLTAIKIIDEEHLELWIWNNAGQKYKLKFKSIEEYLEAGVKCKFVICWQYFYIDTEAIGFNGSFNKRTTTPNFGDSISNMETAFESLKKYFPGENWSYQEKELERVKQLE